jgi:hypothetical protein
MTLHSSVGDKLSFFGAMVDEIPGESFGNFESFVS